MLRIGLLGFGAIGRPVAEAVAAGAAGDVEVTAVLVRDPSRVAAGAAGPGVRATGDPAEFLAAPTDLVVEAAGHRALQAYAERVLAAGKDLMPVSVGAFADPDLLARVRGAAQAHGRRVLIPSGAISGLDGISAAALAAVEEVTHTVRKPPRAFTAEQLGGAAPTTPTVLFDGPAADGVRRFPENVNVAAAVSLAGVGLGRTRLRVIADPGVQHNLHEVRLRGWSGELTIRQRNIPSSSPKTGRVVALSIASALRRAAGSFVVGA